MQLRFQIGLVCLAGALLWGVLGSPTAATADSGRDRDRQRYAEAGEALARGDTAEYRRLRATLDDYPLVIYLDFDDLRRRGYAVTAEEAGEFLRRSEDSPLGLRFLSRYLDRAGRERRWRDFLALMDEEPNTVELKCYYHRARLATGDREEALAGARRLWIHGRSRPDACDPLFAAWMKAGGLGDDAAWQRMLLAFDERQGSLMRYAGRKGSAALAPWADRLQRVYRDPGVLAGLGLPQAEPRSRDVAVHGLVYLARYQPEKALHLWQRYRDRMTFSAGQVETVEYAIALRSLFARSTANRAWVDAALARLKRDKLVEIRLRWALEEQDWAAMDAVLPLLSAEARDDTVWIYWQARIWEQRGDMGRARAGFAALAGERDYYGFLAADRLGRAYAFNDRPLVSAPETREALRGLPGVRRVEELIFHDEIHAAYGEWYWLMGNSQKAQLEGLASLAADRDWTRMAIDAANRAGAWDALDLRFPTPFRDTFTRYGAAQRVASSELMAIARRESAFYPQARSPVGARGLMQVMPATGREVAAALGTPHSVRALYDVDHNVQLGSAYYRRLLDRFDGNRIFALTAYNAGPHRVDRWRNKAGETVPVEVWVETIPYLETRNYVKAVLAYNVVFRQRLGESPGPLLTRAERAASY